MISKGDNDTPVQSQLPYSDGSRNEGGSERSSEGLDPRETRKTGGRLTVSLVQGCETNMNYVMTDKYASVIIAHTIYFCVLHYIVIVTHLGRTVYFLIDTYFLQYVADRFQRKLAGFFCFRKEEKMGKRKQRDPPSFMTAQPHKGFVPMFNDQLNSPAFISLSTVAKVMYLILRQEYKGDYTGNNIICPYSTFVEKGISRNSISDNLRQLEALGFITWENGGLYHQPNHYHFTDGWKKIHTMEDAKSIKDRLAEEKKQRKQAQKQMTEEKANQLS